MKRSFCSKIGYKNLGKYKVGALLQNLRLVLDSTPFYEIFDQYFVSTLGLAASKYNVTAPIKDAASIQKLFHEPTQHCSLAYEKSRQNFIKLTSFGPIQQVRQFSRVSFVGASTVHGNQNKLFMWSLFNAVSICTNILTVKGTSIQFLVPFFQHLGLC